MFRTVSDAAEVRRAVAPLERRVTVEHVLEVPPVHLRTVPGFDSAVFPYTTDIPFLTRWGAPLLFGPGSIHVAHTADEFVSIAELSAAADQYVTRSALADLNAKLVTRKELGSYVAASGLRVYLRGPHAPPTAPP